MRPSQIRRIMRALERIAPSPAQINPLVVTGVPEGSSEFLAELYHEARKHGLKIVEEPNAQT